MDERSKWIWLCQGAHTDQYGEFYDSFLCKEGTLSLRISADSNYAIWVNGTFVYAGQYPDFPHYKIYDEIDLSPYCCEGLNHLALQVWYYGEGNMSYYPGYAALRYEVWQKNELIGSSGENTLSRQSWCYQNGLAKKITPQLGFSFCYDLNREDGWRNGRLEGFESSCIVDQELPLYPRPILRCKVEKALDAQVVLNENNRRFLVDLGREEVGLLCIRAWSDEPQNVMITYGEHITDGGVRRIIENRDFSMELCLKPGINEYVNPFRRLGLRFLELFCEKKVQLEYLTVLPVSYPIGHMQPPVLNELQKQIYDVCVRTLELCMHDHYEDSPWREQALYAMDSRNQMLCGYDAFGEYAFARANLLLMSKDERSDDLLSICTPSADDLTIPSFSLHYFTAVEEYTNRSGDLTLAEEIWPKLERLLAAFTSKLENGCIPVFEEKCHWNFYEWSEGMSGRLMQKDDRRFDAALNCLLSMALQSMHRLAERLDKENNWLETAEEINRQIHARFYDPQRGVYINSTEDDHASVLVNALAILSGAAEGERAEKLAEKLAYRSNDLTPATLSMIGFQYDALLKTDEAKYRGWVLDDIEAKYSRMLEAGATTFWETEKGESDFDNAGSLCHGWSAMPVHYYHKLLDK
ncbi:MAG: hypothetical protein J6K55_09815 [Clostridia bacterium]|nr:hypothetical protein [Clostridia bacterium]